MLSFVSIPFPFSCPSLIKADTFPAETELITSTLTNNQSLLFPIDASPRLLELLVLLDQHWSYSISREAETRTRWSYPLCLVSRTAEEMLVFARSLMEWMGGAVARAHEEGLAAAATGGGGQGGRRGGRVKEVRSPLLFRWVCFSRGNLRCKSLTSLTACVDISNSSRHMTRSSTHSRKAILPPN